jgi:carboxymethylenebutenolidase
MIDHITLTAGDGHRLQAYSALPSGRPRGGLVVIHEFLGLTDYIASVCLDYAAQGYAVAAPALYDRQEPGAQFDRQPDAMERAARLRRGLQWDDVLKDVDAARAHLAEYGGCGIIGFCMGGSVAWLAASTPGFAAAISYYGKDVPDWLDRKPLCPVILHFGDQDKLIPLAGVQAISAAYPEVPVHLYAAGHAFDNPANQCDPAIIAQARARSLEHLRKHVG